MARPGHKTTAAASVLVVISGLTYFGTNEIVKSDESWEVIAQIDTTFLLNTDSTRGLADIPFKPNSWVRNKEHNKEVGGVANSAHTEPCYCATDVSTRNTSGKTSSAYRYKIIKAAMDFNYGQNIYNTLIEHGYSDSTAQALAKATIQKDHYYKRFGVAKSFVHLDSDTSKAQGVLWLY